MRILIHDYAGHAFPVQLSRELARRGHAVTHAYAGGLLTPRGALQRREGDPVGFSVVEVPMSPDYRTNKYSFLKRRGYELAYGVELAALVRRFRPEIILSGNTPTEPQMKFIKAAQASGIPFFSWVQDFYSLAVAKLAGRKIPVLGALVGMWYCHLDKQCLQGSAGVIAITQDFQKILVEFGVPETRVSVIPNWAPLDELPMMGRPTAWALDYGLADKFVFLYSGTLAMKHNPDLLLELALKFRDDPAVRVVVISEGPGADYLSIRRAADKLTNLVLLPFQPFDELPAVLASADVLLAVLEREASVFSVPSKVLTYHTVGRPILGAMPRENLAARIITEQGSGLCVEPENTLDFVTGAVQLRNDAGLRSEMGKRARGYAERAFQVSAIADRFEGLFVRAVHIDPSGKG